MKIQDLVFDYLEFGLYLLDQEVRSNDDLAIFRRV